MMQFIRKHQKIVLMVTTGVISISFVFFGTFSNLLSQQMASSKDVELTKLLDGSSLKVGQVRRMVHFLSSSIEERSPAGGNGFVNLLNDGVLEKDLLSTSIGQQLADHFLSECSADILSRWERARDFSTYAHPKDSSISVESIWASFDPEMAETIRKIKTGDKAPPQEAFALLARAFTKQRQVPLELIRNILTQQQNQASHLLKDPRLAHVDLSICGFHTATDWLGEKYIEFVAQFILNTASIAKKHGYAFSNQAVRKNLMENLAIAVHSLSEKPVSSEELQKLFHRQIHSLGMDDSAMIALWRDVMLFRKVLSHADQIVTVDSSIIEQHSALAKNVALIDVYSLSASLQGLDFSSLLKLQLYIDTISPLKTRGDFLGLPKQISPLGDIEKRMPELVQKKYVVEYAAVKRKDLLAEITLKQVWHWQMLDDHWDVLKRDFSFLATSKAASRQDRFAVLESLSESDRAQLDLFSQNAILNQNLDLIKQALQKAPKKTKELRLSIKMKDSPFAFKNLAPIMTYLDKAPLPSEKSPSAESIVAQKVLQSYSQDQESYYSIHLISRDDAKQIVSFTQALSLGILDPIFNKRLDEVYIEARKKDLSTYQTSTGFKTIDQVQEPLARYAFADLLKGIEKQYADHFGIAPTAGQMQNPAFYVTYRFLRCLQEARKDIQSDPKDSKWVSLPGSKQYHREVDKQWLLVKSQKHIAKSDPLLFSGENLFDMPADSWSSIVSTKEGALAFIHMIKSEELACLPVSAEKKLEDLRRSHAQTTLIEDLLIEIEKKGAIRSIPGDTGTL